MPAAKRARSENPWERSGDQRNDATVPSTRRAQANVSLYTSVGMGTQAKPQGKPVQDIDPTLHTTRPTVHEHNFLGLLNIFLRSICRHTLPAELPESCNTRPSMRGMSSELDESESACIHGWSRISEKVGRSVGRRASSWLMRSFTSASTKRDVLF